MEETPNQSINHTLSLPRNISHFKTLQTVEVEHGKYILGYSDHYAAWDSKHKLDNPIRVLVPNVYGPIYYWLKFPLVK